MTFNKAAYHITILTIAAGITLSALITNTYANTSPPIPIKKQINLGQLEEKIEGEKQQQKKLQSKLKDIEKDLGETKSSLINLTKNIQTQETSLRILEQKIKKLRKEKLDITESLEKEYGSIANLILALQRIRRMPPEAIIIRPAPPLKTAQTALLLQGMLPGIYKRAENLSIDLTKLQEVTRELEDKQKILQTDITSLDKKYDSMSRLIKKRETLYKKIKKDYDEHSDRIDRLAKEAKSMQELMTKLEEDRQRRKKEERKAQKQNEEIRTASIRSIPKKIIPYLPGGGGSRLPVTGTIRIGFGDTDSFGAKSEGISIESRHGAVVVAPMAGKVRFAGFFKNYGNIVIIEHEDGYHSLVAGLSRIDTVVGLEMDSGEPIGLMLSTGDRAPLLYYELRYEGKPVSPSKKIAGLG